MIRRLFLLAALCLVLLLAESSASTATTLQSSPLLDQIVSHRFAVRPVSSSARRSFSGIQRPRQQCPSAIDFLTPRPSPRGGATARVVRTITATQKELLKYVDRSIDEWLVDSAVSLVALMQGR